MLERHGRARQAAGLWEPAGLAAVTGRYALASYEGMKTLAKILRIVAINVVVLVALLALLEGAASLLFMANEVRLTPARAEQSYSKYDETLGWVSQPNVNLPDLYGRGISLRTNAQGFRNDHDITPAVPAGKIRIICSGDSFTLGFGVDNDHAWCQRLAALDRRLETVNLGQGGYGLDQAYLWYVRAGMPLEHQVQLLAFITDDFLRMRSDRFLGYGKPLLDVRNDSIVITNRPVPKTSWITRFLAVKGHAIGNLNVVRLFYRLFRRSAVEGDAAMPSRDQGPGRIAAHIFDQLVRLNREKKSQLVLVYLPGPGDYRSNDATTAWRGFVSAEASRLGIPYVDVVDAIRKVPPTEVNDLFAPNLHYSVKGNEFVAATLVKAVASSIDGRRTQ